MSNKKVEFIVNRDSEMLEINIEGSKWKFCGNFWDFSTPRDIIDFAKALDLEVTVTENTDEDE